MDHYLKALILSCLLILGCNDLDNYAGVWQIIKSVNYECIVSENGIEHVSGITKGQSGDTIRIDKQEITYYSPSINIFEYGLINDSLGFFRINKDGKHYKLPIKFIMKSDTLILSINPNDTCNKNNIYNLVSGDNYLIKIQENRN